MRAIVALDVLNCKPELEDLKSYITKPSLEVI